MTSSDVNHNFDWDFQISKAYEQDGKRLIQGIATIENADTTNEIVEFESVRKSFEGYMQRSPVVLLNHDDNKPIGQITKYEPQEVDGIKKMFVVAEIDQPSNPYSYVNEAWELIESGTYRGFSIRGTPEKRWISKGIKHVSMRRLSEVSVVAVGAHQDALFEVISKSLGTSQEQLKTQGRNKMDDEITKQINDRLDQMETKMDTKLDSFMDRISKKLDIPSPEEEAFQTKIEAGILKSLKGNKEFASIAAAMNSPEIKKALGGSGSGADPSSDPNKSSTETPTEVDEIRKKLDNLTASDEPWSVEKMAKYEELQKQLINVEAAKVS